MKRVGYLALVFCWLSAGLVLGQTLLLTLDDPNPQGDARFGFSLAVVGDVNGDGVPDLAVGASLQNVDGNFHQGQAFVFSGATGTLLLTLNDPNPQAYAAFGFSLAGIGDINGDGVPDLAVGAPFQRVDVPRSQGQAFVFSGASGALLLTLDPPPQTSLFGFFGTSLASVGDVNGDTVPDLAVAASDPGVSGLCQGRAFLFSAATGALLLTLDNPDQQNLSGFSGHSLAGVGDVNGDGVPDLAVGAWRQDVGGTSGQGQAFVFSGATGDLLLTLDDPNPQRFAAFGLSVTGVGDVNGDTVPDLAVGAPRQNVGGNFSQGQAFVFSGATGDLLLTLDDPNPQRSASFGLSLTGVGDVNGDGVPDLAVGTILKDLGGNLNQGQAFVFSGATGALLLTLNDPNPKAHAAFGFSLAGVGDINGDGVPDLAVGAFRQEVGSNLQGQVFVFDINRVPLAVPIDIKPLACPNKLNDRSLGVIPIAILGAEDFDVTTIERNSIRLSGVAPFKRSLEDVATPFVPFVGKETQFDCTDEGPDGLLDLTLKFDNQEVIQGIEIFLGREVNDGEIVILPLTGNLLEEFGGTPIRGEDVVVIKK